MCKIVATFSGVAIEHVFFAIKSIFYHSPVTSVVLNHLGTSIVRTCNPPSSIASSSCTAGTDDATSPCSPPRGVAKPRSLSASENMLLCLYCYWFLLLPMNDGDVSQRRLSHNQSKTKSFSAFSFQSLSAFISRSKLRRLLLETLLLEMRVFRAAAFFTSQAALQSFWCQSSAQKTLKNIFDWSIKLAAFALNHRLFTMTKRSHLNSPMPLKSR